MKFRFSFLWPITVMAFAGLLRAEPQPDTADQDFATYQTLANAEMQPDLSPLERMKRFEQISLQRREAALAFIERHPNDPRRWIVVDRLNTLAPRFVKEWGPLDEDGWPIKPVVDAAAVAAWTAKVEGLKAALAKATDVPEELKAAWAGQKEMRKKYQDQVNAFAQRWRGQMAPDFTVLDWAGRAVKLSDLRGKIVVLDFWATWCGPCVASMPHTQEVAARYKDQGVVVLASCTSDTRTAFEKWVNKNQNKYPDMIWAHDPAGKGDDAISGRLFEVQGIPTQFVIDREGRVVDVVTGYHKGDVILEAVLSRAGVTVDPALVAQGNEQRQQSD